MFFDKPEDNTQKLDNKIEELMLDLENLDKEIDRFFTDFDIPNENHEKYENKDNFTKAEWEAITETKKTVDEMIHKNASNVRNPNKIKKSYNDLHLASHWIPMR